ncbi:TM2 domain-containing protein [Gordonia otitidis]|uniref:TM2 domain-containing protein n=1 Tax=Gordonia otitidis TaxID=249058 RepID=UPI001D13A802|nr:NINE protein [Gordonia otitidis]UEA58172.1 TM2 domain-containing protein [Gordonia otitidis]
MSYPDNTNHDPAQGQPYGSPSPFGPSPAGEQSLPLPYEHRTADSSAYFGPSYGAPGYGAPGYGAGQGPVGYGPQGGYLAAGYPGAVDPMAPFGRDPFTGEPLSNKSKVAAGLLQLFLGGFGAGRFYLGYTAIGVTQLVLLIIGWITSFFLIGLFILAGLSVWVLIDAIMMFTGSVRDSNGYKLQS